MKIRVGISVSDPSDESTLLDQLCEVLGWSGDTARRRLTCDGRTPIGI